MAKVCTGCGKEKDETEYHNAGRGRLKSKCRVCVSAQRRDRYANHMLKEEFRKQKQLKQTQYRLRNLEKSIQREREYRNTNAASIRENANRYSLSDKGKKAKQEWSQRNVEKRKQIARDFCRRHPEKLNYGTAKRRAAKKKATVPFNPELTALVLEEAYLLAVMRSKTVGGTWHVDHIVPLQSDLVCGLHTWSNIAVITKEENLRKGNKSWPHMSLNK